MRTLVTKRNLRRWKILTLTKTQSKKIPPEFVGRELRLLLYATVGAPCLLSRDRRPAIAYTAGEDGRGAVRPLFGPKLPTAPRPIFKHKARD